MDDRLISEEENRNTGITQRAFNASAYRSVRVFSLRFKTRVNWTRFLILSASVFDLKVSVAPPKAETPQL